jgi:hypothetical protein
MRRACSGAVLAIVSSLLAPAGSAAQAAARPAEPAARLEMMKNLEVWAGEWEGSGWSNLDGNRRVTFNVEERVQRKVGGTVLVAEGRSTTTEGTGTPTVTHDGIALVYFDEKTRQYRWHGHDVPSGTTETEVTLVDGGFEWRIRPSAGGGTVRFTIKFDEQRWHEVGEASADGTSWYRFMEMTLRRRKPQ